VQESFVIELNLVYNTQTNTIGTVFGDIEVEQAMHDAFKRNWLYKRD
jgi:hypothetical protein